MLMGPPFGKERKPEVGIQMYTKGVDIASGFLQSRVESTDPAVVFACGHFPAAMSV